MATKSFFKTVDIRDEHSADTLATALQQAENVHPTIIEYKSTPQELKCTDITDFFDSYKKQHDNF